MPVQHTDNRQLFRIKSLYHAHVHSHAGLNMLVTFIAHLGTRWMASFGGIGGAEHLQPPSRN
jgi:hypothetical protein